VPCCERSDEEESRGEEGRRGFPLTVKYEEDDAFYNGFDWESLVHSFNEE
jgi:hypothetical protein